ncbi:MAG: D-2-hydroxyacid dehydrogenase [Streptosporangiales bacterium]|nr:D-2-hydroxyacid dehydrogenase [Streptosporangiales bacterium]
MDEVEALAEVRYASAAELPRALPGTDVLFMWDFLSTALRDAGPYADRLRWIHQAGAGVDRVLVPWVVDGDVTVTNSRGVFDRSIAEYVLGLVLAFAKDLPHTLALQRGHTWRHRETEMVHGRSALVVGAGPIGRMIARLLRGVGMEVSGVGRTARAADDDFGAVLAASDLHEALPDADYVVVAAPLTDDTRGMFDAAAFAAMRPTARFVNIGRGEIVVEPDLVAALRSGRLAGAALDVFEREPLPEESPLWDMPNVVVSPHMSADFIGWLDVLADVFVDNFKRWHAGEPLRNVVDKQLGYVSRENA